MLEMRVLFDPGLLRHNGDQRTISTVSLTDFEFSEALNFTLDDIGSCDWFPQFESMFG